jgi:hypothetical protein
VGDDRVILRGEHLAVLSSTEMPDWEVRAHRKALIRYDGRTWTPLRKVACPGKRFRYELTPWNPGPMDAPGVEIDYGPDYVRHRDEAIRAGRRMNVVSTLLHWSSPLIGFLGSGTKRRLEAVYGLDPVAATRRSLHLEILLLLGSGALISIGKMVEALGSAPPWPVRPMVFGFVLVGLDTLMRYSRVLREERYPPGLFQWLWNWIGRGRR